MYTYRRQHTIMYNVFEVNKKLKMYIIILFYEGTKFQIYLYFNLKKKKHCYVQLQE